MNILITGGAGYIGSHTSLILSNSGFRPIIYDNFSNSDCSTIDHLSALMGEKAICVEGDIRDQARLISTLKNHNCQAVIHFAGLKAVGESNELPLLYYDSNVSGTIQLLEAMKKCGIKRFIFSSSATVYGEPQYLPLDEKHPLSPTNPYGRSKWMIEQILYDLFQSDPSWTIVLLRYFNPVGAHPSGLIGENPKNIPNNLMPYVAQVAKGILPQLSVWGQDYPTTDGTGIRDFIHVLDLAEGHLAALQKIQKPCIEAFNLGTGQGYSVLNLVETFETTNQVKVPFVFGPRRLGDIASCFANCDKAWNQLGWKASRQLNEMCLDTWRFQLQQSA
jgi:UDP-glucose 4-epimerase